MLFNEDKSAFIKYAIIFLVFNAFIVLTSVKEHA